MAFNFFRGTVFCACIFALSCCLSANADVIFSNITGPTSAFYLASGDPICDGSAPDCHYFTGIWTDAAAAFTPTVDFTLTEAQVVINDGSVGSSDGNSFDVTIWSDSNGLPGSEIGNVGGTGISPPAPPSILSVSESSTPFTLLAGTQYWVVLEEISVDCCGFVVWERGGSSNEPTATSTCTDFDTQCLSGPGADPDAPWTSAGSDSLQFEIDGVPTGAPVPEPSTFLLTTIGLALCFCGARYRRRASVRG
jgi:hypothetical protein